MHASCGLLSNREGTSYKKMVLVAGVDSSTQGCKVVVCDSSTGEVLRLGKAQHPPGTEVDPNEWLLALKQAVKAAGGLEDVKAISIAGQQHGMVCLDANGEVVRKALLWNDNRSAQNAKDLIKEIGGPQVYAERVGIVPVASFTASKLRWLRDNEPQNAEKVAAVCLPHDWLTWRIMGYGPSNPDLDALVTDASDASGTAYWSGETKKYDHALFKHALGREMREAKTKPSSSAVIVPRVLRIDESAGKSSNDVIPQGIVVGAGAGDNAGGALGLNISPNDIVVSLGTSGAVFTLQEGSIHKGDPSGVVAYFSAASGENLPLVCTLNGARVLDAAARVLGLDGPSQLEPLALKSNPGSDGLVLLPYFEGERTPNLPNAKASMHNMTLSNMTPNNIARCYIESLMCSMAQAVKAVTKGKNNKQEKLFLIGGAAKNPAVQLVASTVFDVDSVYIPTPAEYVAKGAAMQAAWAFLKKNPEWKTPVDTKLPTKFDARILEQYEKAQFKEYPELGSK